MNKKIIAILIFYFILQLYLSQYHELQSDEGTHGLIGIFYNDAIINIMKFHSIDDIKNFAFDFILKYPKVSPYYPPLYHILLATVFFINKSVLILRILNILITALTGLVVFEISKELGLKEKGAFISLIFFLVFSLIFYYADKIMIDILQILTFSLALLYYIKIRNKKNLDLRNVVVLSILLVLAFSTKFYSIFLPLIILIDAIFNNKKIIKELILSFVISLLVLSPYLYFYFNFKIYKLTINLSNIPFKNNWVYFDIFSNFGMFAGIFVTISMIWFLYKNGRNVLLLSWFFIPLIALLYINNKDPRFAFILMPIYAISCGSFYTYLEKTKWKKIALIIVSLIVSSQIVYDIYINSTGENHAPDKIIELIKKNGNVLITSESPVYSSVYMFYGNLYGVAGNFIRPCALQQKVVTKDFLDRWGIRYVIDQNNSISDASIAALNLNLIEDNKIKLFEYDVKNEVDCNFICLLNGKLCGGDGFSRLLELINNRTNITD